MRDFHNDRISKAFGTRGMSINEANELAAKQRPDRVFYLHPTKGWRSMCHSRVRMITTFAKKKA